MAFRDLYGRYDEDRRDSAPGDPAIRQRDPVSSTNLALVIWRRKAFVLATIALFLLGGIGYIAVTPPRYLASTAMLIDPRLGKTVGADPVQPGFVVDTGAIDSQIKLFTSQTVLARVAAMADLTHDPEFNGSNRSLIQRILHPQAQLEGGVDLKALEDAITIKRPERTYVIGIDVLARDPARAAEIANDLTTAYIEDQVSARVDAAHDDTRFVRQQLTKLAGQIKDAEEKVEQFKLQNNVVDTSGLRTNEQQVADLTKALGDARAKTSAAKARLEAIERAQKLGRLDATNDALKSLTIERLRQDEAEAAESLARLAMTLGAKHPALLEARARQTKVEKLIHDELQRLALGASSDYDSARRNEAQIEADVGRLKEQSAKLSRDLVPLEQLERNVAVLRASFERFAHVRDNLSQQEADSPPGRVIATARPPVSPAQPKKVVVGLISLAAGVFFGLAGALFVEAAQQARRERAPAPLDFAPARPAEAPAAYEFKAPPPAPAPRPPQQVRRRYWDDDDA